MVHIDYSMTRTGDTMSDNVVLVRKAGIPLAWLEGTQLAERRGLRVRRAELADARQVRLVGNRVGGAYLSVEDSQGGTAGCQLLVVTAYSDRHVSANGLDRLREALAGSEAANAARVRELLAEQADYLRSGQGLMGSPLRTHSELLTGSLGDPHQELPLPGGDGYRTVPRDHPAAPDDGFR